MALDIGKCVHCLKDGVKVNSDHVFPQSWYPEGSAENLYKWQIPSCIKCNDEYGRLEKDLMIRIGMCLDPEDPACKGIVEKANRAIDPSKARNNKDRKHRLRKRQQIISELMPEAEIPTQSIYPGFEKKGYAPGEQAGGIIIKQSHTRKLAEKIVRGLLYLEEGVFVSEDYNVHTYTINDQGATPIMEILDKFGVIHSREPGILVKRATVPEDKTTSIFYIEIWRRFKLYSVVQRKSA